MAGRTLFFVPEAEREAREAFHWYWQHDEAISRRFEATLTGTLERISEAPEQGAKLQKEVRRCLVSGFPYSVLYVIEPI